MVDLEIELPEFHVQPGEVQIAREPAILKTILGSCVGVTFWSARIGVGALCHGVLPRFPGGIRVPEAYRYVDFAILDLIGQLESLGARRREIQIKAFGGADVLPTGSGRSTNQSVGRQNRDSALEVLRTADLRVMASDLGGTAGRVLQFNTATGEVLLRRLAHLNESMARRTEGQKP